MFSYQTIQFPEVLPHKLIKRRRESITFSYDKRKQELCSQMRTPAFRMGKSSLLLIVPTFYKLTEIILHQR